MSSFYVDYVISINYIFFVMGLNFAMYFNNILTFELLAGFDQVEILSNLFYTYSNN